MVFKGSVAVRTTRVSKEINNRYPEYHYGEFVITFFSNSETALNQLKSFLINLKLTKCR